MQQNRGDTLRKCFVISHDGVNQTATEFPNNAEKSLSKELIKKTWYDSKGATEIFRHISLLLLVLLCWGLLWLTLGAGWGWNGPWFRLSAVGLVAWSSGQLLQGITTLPPLLAALLTGILSRSFGFLDMRDFTSVDVFLRKIYPVLILGKGSLGWDLDYMRQNWKQVTTLGVLPWSAEVLTMAVCTHVLLDFPWLWGVLLGAVYASVSCPVIMPSMGRIGVRRGRNWPQLVCAAGGTDTALSVSVYGLVLSLMFSDVGHTYRYIKASLTLVTGVAAGATWGYIAGRLPHPGDYYVTQFRVLFVLLGGLFANFFTLHVSWEGTAGVAILVCNATAAHYWRKDGWRLNNNAASTTYRVLWASVEPLVFAYTGTFFVLDAATGRTLVYGFAILAICLTIRLTVASLVCWDMNIKEKIFFCGAWMPKSVVEAVLGPVAINTLLIRSHTEAEMGYAEDILRLLVQAILITTPIGFLLTHYLGPRLLAEKPRNDQCNDNR